jgi:hypothetical protein
MMYRRRSRTVLPHPYRETLADLAVPLVDWQLAQLRWAFLDGLVSMAVSNPTSYGTSVETIA